MRCRTVLVTGVVLTAALATAAVVGSREDGVPRIRATVGGNPAAATIRWPAVKGATRYRLDLGDRSIEVGVYNCNTAECELGVDAAIAPGKAMRVVAVADSRVLARSNPVEIGVPEPERPGPIFDVVAVVEGADGPEIKVYPAASQREADTIRRRLEADPTVLETEQDGTMDQLQSPKGTVVDVGWPAEAMQLVAAHSISTGAGTIVAVVDSGIWANHPDLRGRVLPGADIPARLKGESRTGTVLPTEHGTAIAGVLAGNGGNGRPLGVAPATKILPVDVKGRDQAIKHSSLAAGILWATRQGARIISISSVAPVKDKAIASAISFATAKGVLVVAGVGNKGVDEPPCSQKQSGKANAAMFPAALPDVVAVGGTEANGRVSKCSHRGAYLDLVAPAIDLTLLGSSGRSLTRISSGTSYSGPAVAGAAALLLSVDPSLSRERLVQILESSARRGPDRTAYGRGLVSPYRALLTLRPAATTAVATDTLQDTPGVMADAPPFHQLGCGSDLAPTTYLSSHDLYTRYTVWMRPPGRSIPQSAGPVQEMTDSLVALELVNRTAGIGPYSDPAVNLFYGLGRSTNPTDYAVTYDAEHKATVSGPVVMIYPRYQGDPQFQPMYDGLQTGCRPEYGYRSFTPEQATVFPGLFEQWRLQARQLVVRDPAVEPGRYALLVFFDGFLRPSSPWNPPWWSSGRFPIVTVGPRSTQPG